MTPSPEPSSTHYNIIVPATVADAISIPSPLAPIHIEVPNAIALNHSAADAYVDEEVNNDTSTGRRSVNSNETHRPGPEYIIKAGNKVGSLDEWSYFSQFCRML